MIKKISLTSLVLMILFLLVMPLKTYATSVGTIYISPSSLSQENGTTFTVALMINPGTAVNAVQANVNYNPNYLQYVSNSTSGSAFPTCVQDSPESTAVVFACTILSGSVSSNAEIASITFKAISNGTTALTLSNANAANNGTWTNPASLNSSVGIYTPAPKPQPKAPTSTSASSSNQNYYTNQSTSTPTSSTTSKPVQTQSTKPNISVKSINQQVQSNQVQLAITTNTAATILVKYGVNANNLNQQISNSKNSTNNQLSLTNLIPNTTYYYKVFTSLNGQIITTSPLKSFKTIGLTITVVILTKNFKPIQGQTFYLNNLKNKTTSNQNGQVTFYNQSPGNNQLIYFINHKEIKQSFYVPTFYQNHQLINQKTIITLNQYNLAALNQSDLAGLITITLFIIGIAARIIIGHKHHLMKSTKTLSLNKSNQPQSD